MKTSSDYIIFFTLQEDHSYNKILGLVLERPYIPHQRQKNSLAR